MVVFIFKLIFTTLQTLDLSNYELTLCLSFFLLLLLTIIPFFFLYQSVGKSPNKHGLPPGPTSWPIVGSFLAMLRNKPHFRWVLATAEGKDITCIRLAGVHIIVVNSPELARQFLKKHDASFASRPLTMATEYSGRHFLSVVVSPWGDQWRKMRRIMASEVLSQSRIRRDVSLRREEADFLVHFIYNLYKKEKANVATVVDLRRMTRFYTGNVIRRMVFGKRWLREEAMRVEGLEGIKDEVEYVEAAFTVLSLIYAFCPSDYMSWLRLLDLGGHERIMRRAIAVINRHHDPVIEERVKMWRDGRKKVAEDILDALISVKDDNGGPLLTVEEVKAQSAVSSCMDMNLVYILVPVNNE